MEERFRNDDDNSLNRYWLRRQDSNMLKFEDYYQNSMQFHSRTLQENLFPLLIAGHDSQRSIALRGFNTNSFQRIMPQEQEIRVVDVVKEESASPPMPTQALDNDTRKGLRFLALRVSELLREMGSATYREVSNLLVDQLVPQKMSQSLRQKQEKNIKRRVYDALNVLIAVGVIEKKAKSISVKEQSSRGKCLTSNSWDTIKNLQKKEQDLIKAIQHRETHLRNITEKYLSMKKLLKRNKSSAETPKQGIFRLPILFTRTSGKEVKVFASEQRDFMVISSTNKIILKGDFDLVKEVQQVTQQEVEKLVGELMWDSV